MKGFKIFVEGDADKTFIQQYIAFIKNLNAKDVSTKDIIACGGRTKLWFDKASTNPFGQAIENNITPLIIFDADNSANDTRKEIEQKLGDIGFQPSQYSLFLFPNNQDPGDLEVLLERIIPSKNQPIFECWEKYERCLQLHATPLVRPAPLLPLTTPARKTKIYGYLEALLGDSNTEKKKIKERERTYNNPEHWELNSSFLSPLREFLEAHL